MEGPLVSVVLPAYNSDKYICGAVDSVLEQTYSEIELIIIDDGSVDATAKVLEQYRGRVKYIYQENAGVSAARNHGIRQSKGELIAFIDADDFWYPQKIHIQVREYLNNPAASMIYTECDRQTRFNGYQPIEEEKTKAVIKDFISIFKMPYLKPTTVMIARHALEKNGFFDEGLPTAEDVDLFLRYSYQQTVLFIPQVLVFMLINAGSLGHSLRSYQDNIDVVDKFITHHSEFYLKNHRIVNEVKGQVYKEYAEELCFKGYSLRSMQSAIRAFLLVPDLGLVRIFSKAFIKLFLGKLNINR